ncbi:MAG: MFS transporter [Brevibacillus sp.]|nr:MFS transporter [Brevibacillus sp.]
MRNKVYYLTGAGASSLGDGIQQIGMIWMIYHYTGSTFSIGVMIAINYLPSIFLTPLLSVLADHHDVQKLAVRIDLIRFAATAATAVLILLQWGSAELLYALQAILAICYTLFKPSSQSLIKRTFDDQDLAFVLSKSMSVNMTATMAGSGLAGLLLSAASPGICFALNALSFLVSAWCNQALWPTFDREERPGKIRFGKELVEGGRFLVTQRGMLYLLFLSVISSAALQMTAAVLLPYARHFGGGGSMYALFDILFTGGTVLAGLVTDRALRRWGLHTVKLTMAGMALLSLCNALSSQVWAACISLIGLGFFTMMHLLTIQTMIQLLTPSEFIGRVVGLRTVIASMTKVSASLLTGYLLSFVGLAYVFLGFGLLVVLSLATTNRVKQIRLPSALFR